MQHKEFVIIGNGVASKLLAFYLYQKLKTPITVIASEDFAPMCSTRTTAINCLRGTQKGLSALGDMMVDSFDEFVDFFQEYQPDGIEKSVELQLWQENREKWLRRFGICEQFETLPFFQNALNECFEGYQSDAYIFHPEVFLEWLDNQYEKEFLNDYVINVEKMGTSYQIQTQKGEIVECQYLYLCTSYESPLFSNLVSEDKLRRELEHSKPVAGTYLKFDINDFDLKEVAFKKSFSLVFDQIHLIFRRHANDVLIGSTSSNNSKNFLPDETGIFKQYETLQKHLQGVLTLPSFDKAELITGIRHKGQRRTPFWGKINDNCYGVWGLYKNAFSLGFSAAKELTQLTANMKTENN